MAQTFHGQELVELSKVIKELNSSQIILRCRHGRLCISVLHRGIQTGILHTMENHQENPIAKMLLQMLSIGAEMENKLENLVNHRIATLAVLLKRQVFRIMPIRFTFSYKQDKWILKSVIRKEHNLPEHAISGALGLYPDSVLRVTNNESFKINAKWMSLLSN